MAPIRYHRFLYIIRQHSSETLITNHRARLVTSFTSISQYYYYPGHFIDNVRST